MGYKNDDRCLDKARDDEPIFVLLARDPIASTVVRIWAELAELQRVHQDKVDEAREHALRMEQWAAEKGGRS